MLPTILTEGFKVNLLLCNKKQKKSTVYKDNLHTVH